MRADAPPLDRPAVRPVVYLYLSGLVQGLVLVSFAASSATLKSMHGFTDAQYGAIFLPQVAAVLVGALAGGSLAPRLGLRHLLWLALLVDALSQLLLAATPGLTPDGALTALLAGTACMGLGFGLSGGPLNGLPPLFFPRRRDSALVALHTLLGLGLAAGPLIASGFISAGYWVGFPLLLAGLCGVLILAVLTERFPSGARMPGRGREQASAMAMADPMPLPLPQAPGRGADTHPMREWDFWLFAAIAMLYAFAEGSFGNWAVLYLQDVKRLPEAVAAGGLSIFWTAMVAGRLLTSLLVLRIPPRRIWSGLPLLMILAFELMPYADTAALGVALFALAGLACSAFFPLSIGLACERFPTHVPWVSSMLIAALMVGVGLGSFAIGVLREVLAFERLYQLSAAYPIAVLALARLLPRGAHRR